jgi:hypothetical protein
VYKVPKNVNQIVYGKLGITSDEPLTRIKAMLDAILREHGYPETGTKADKAEIEQAEKDFKDQLAVLEQDDQFVRKKPDGRTPRQQVPQSGPVPRVRSRSI